MDTIQFQVGRMTKDPRNMTDHERASWKQKCAEHAREFLFSINQPLVYRNGEGKLVAEYKDGKTSIVQ